MWDWQRISIGALAVIAIVVGGWLVRAEDNDSYGAAVLAVGAILSGAWLAITIIERRDRP